MADTAYQTQYRQEFIHGFEKRQSLVRKSVTTEATIKGNSAVFLVADSGGATAVTRGVNGDIPTRPENLNQYTATLREWHDIPERTGFNIFASQGDARRIMQETSMAVINRKIDTDVNTELETASVTWGAAQTADLAAISVAKTKLGNAFAGGDNPDDVWAQITPAYQAYLMAMAEFASSDYINQKPFEGVSKDIAFRWWGVNWIVNAALTGVGTSSSTCLMYHKAAIGHAAKTDTMETFVGYDEKQDKSWQRCTMYMGAKLLQNSGVVKMPHDDSAFS
jgi:hypothetical protein